MTRSEVEMLRSTLHDGWTFEFGTSIDACDQDAHPIAICRELIHPDYLLGVRFIQKIAAIAEMNSHFPSITLERRIVRKTWQVVSHIRCHTSVLRGLSANDFHLAMVRADNEGCNRVKFKNGSTFTFD